MLIVKILWSGKANRSRYKILNVILRCNAIPKDIDLRGSTFKDNVVDGSTIVVKHWNDFQVADFNIAWVVFF